VVDIEPVCLSGNKRERDDEDGVQSSLPRAEGGVQESVGFGANKHGRHEVDKEASTPPLCPASSSVSGATTTCAARCESCKQGCGCSAWDTTNHAIIDGAKICCYDCYKVMCDEKATPVSVQHLNEGMPFIISRKATGDLDTDRARVLCEKMVAAMRQLEKRRHHELQYGVTGDRIQIREARKHVWQEMTVAQQEKFFKSIFKHLLPELLGERSSDEVYRQYLESSHALGVLRRTTAIEGLSTMYKEPVTKFDVVGAVGGEGIFGKQNSKKQPLHGDLPPHYTAQMLSHVNAANSSTNFVRYRAGKDDAHRLLVSVRNEDGRNTKCAEETFLQLLYNYKEPAACIVARGREEERNIIDLPVYPGRVEVGHTTLMHQTAWHYGGEVAEGTGRAIHVETAFKGSRLEYELNTYADFEPLQVSGLALLAQMGLHHVIYTSPSLQGELRDPHFQALCLEKHSAPGGLTPAAWAGLANPRHEPQQQCNVIRMPAGGSTFANGFVTMYRKAPAPQLLFAHTMKFTAAQKKKGLHWGYVGCTFDEEIAYVESVGARGLTFQPIEGDDWEEFTVTEPHTLLVISAGLRCHMSAPDGAVKQFSYIKLKDGQRIEVQTTDDGEYKLLCDVCNSCCWYLSYNVAPGVVPQHRLGANNDLCPVCYTSSLKECPALASTAEQRAFGRARRATDRAAPCIAAFEHEMMSATASASEDLSAFEFRGSSTTEPVV
jgi:hypothetical protein